MSNEGTVAACKATLVVFGMVFLFSIFRDCTVKGACFRGAVVGLVTFPSVKLLYHIFFSAVVDGISEYIRNDQIGNTDE